MLHFEIMLSLVVEDRNSLLPKIHFQVNQQFVFDGVLFGDHDQLVYYRGEYITRTNVIKMHY